MKMIPSAAIRGSLICSCGRVLLLVVFSCLLASCAPKKKVSIPVFKDEQQEKKAQPASPPAAPAQVPAQKDSPKPAAPKSEAAPEAAPDSLPEIAPPAHIPPPPGQAGSLLASANKAMQAGQLDKAEMHLERALRLSPREAQLWHGMAKVRYAQGNYAQAVQFCLKSNSLAGKNGVLVGLNWLLMEKAYLGMGEKEKAAQARKKASEKF